MSKISPTVAVVFHRLGPYYFARLQAVGRLLPIVGMETSGIDETYAWDLIAGADGFERVTLFEKADAQKLPAVEVVPTPPITITCGAAMCFRKYSHAASMFCCNVT